MISFRKHAQESTRRPDSFLKSHARASYAAALASALLSLLLAAPSGAAAPRPKRKAAPRAQAGAAPGARRRAGGGPEEKGAAAGSEVPVRVRRVETTDGPVVMATIGEFPSDLKEEGQAFLLPEFFEHFASDVLGLGESDPKAATLKVSMLPQEKENQREGDFTFGEVSGHIVVLVERRRVLVACSFSEAVAAPRMLARAPRERFGAGAAE